MRQIITKIVSFFKKCIGGIKRSPETGTKESLIAQGIESYGKVFAGLYEPLYMVADGKLGGKLSVIGEWSVRISNLNDETPFRECMLNILADYRDWEDSRFIETAKLVLRGIQKAGVIRDDFSELVIDETAEIRYGTLDGRTLVRGEKESILKPCWHLGGIILDRGILK